MCVYLARLSLKGRNERRGSESSYIDGGQIDELLWESSHHIVKAVSASLSLPFTDIFFAAMRVCLHRHALSNARLSKAESTLLCFSL